MSNFGVLSTFDLKAKVNPKEVIWALKKLDKITPERIVEVAANKENLLHKYFEWDDGVAAHKFRLSQARHLVLSISIETSSGITRAYESVTLDNEKMYVPIGTIASTPELAAQVLQGALNELLYWKAKHQRFQSFFKGIFGEISVLEERLRNVNEKGKKGKGTTTRGKVRYSANKKARRHDNHNRGLTPTR